MSGLRKTPCRKCGGTDFYPTLGKCRPCARKYRSKRAADPEIAARLNSYYARYNKKPEVRAHRRQKEIERLLKKYGLTIEDRTRILKEQDGNCAACGRPLGEASHIDHDHETGEFRGILHPNCNTALGLIEDSPEVACQLALYLRRHGK